MPWYSTQAGHRSFTASDRLPDIHLPQACPVSTSPATRPSRGGSFDSSSNYSNTAPSLTSSYSSVDTGLGIKTPPSGDSPEAPAAHFSKDQPFFQEVGYSGAMNQGHSYIDGQHPQISTSSSYVSQPQTSGMSHYQQYPTPATNAYGPTQSSYSHYYGGVTSPQSAGQPVSASIGAQLLPLPGQCSLPWNWTLASTCLFHFISLIANG